MSAMDRADPWLSPAGSTRSRADLLAQILLPLIANVVLAMGIWTHLPPGANVGADIVTDPIPIGPVLYGGSTLPLNDVNSVIIGVELATNHRYDCKGPWVISGGVLKWACRTPQSLVVIVGSPSGKAFLIEGTWFAFDRTATDLPAWAAAVQPNVGLSSAMRTWAVEHVGTVATTTIGGVDLRSGGARGAFTLAIEAH